MNLESTFRLYYGEGKGKRVEKDFNLFRLGYKCGVEDSAKIADVVASGAWPGMSDREAAEGIAKAIRNQDKP